MEIVMKMEDGTVRELTTPAFAGPSVTTEVVDGISETTPSA